MIRVLLTYYLTLIDDHEASGPDKIPITVLRKTLTVEKSDEIWWMKHVRKFDEQNFDKLS